jgi:hypothetical protein
MSRTHLEFKDLLMAGHFKDSEDLILQDIYDVEDVMEALTDEDFSKIESHWSAVNTGDMISTPFEVLKKISDFINFKENSSLIDLGSGHGHPSFVFRTLNPTLKITGYELVEAKVIGARKSANRLGLKNVYFETQDLSDHNFKIPHADYFYMHNPFNQEVANQISKKMFQLKKEKPLTVISTGGRELTPLLDLGFKTTKQITDLGISILT